jgi:hypothetical protein
LNTLISQVEQSSLKEHPEVMAIKKVLDYLQAIIQDKLGTLGTEWRYRYDENLNTIPVPSDGNCLFHAASALLELSNKGILNAAQLRASVADEIDRQYKGAEDSGIQEQPPECETPGILDHLRASMESYQAVRRQALADDLSSLLAQENMGEALEPINRARARVNEELEKLGSLTRAEYVALCRQEGFHGGSVEIYIISQLFQVRIDIERLYVAYVRGKIESFRRIRGFDRIYGAEFETAITLVNMGGDHYDAGLPHSEGASE